MKITKTPISDLIILEPKIFGDDRGYFIESFQEKWFIENANPMEDDLESMHESLMHLFKFLNEEELLPKNFLNEVSTYLKKD